MSNKAVEIFLALSLASGLVTSCGSPTPDQTAASPTASAADPSASTTPSAAAPAEGGEGGEGEKKKDLKWGGKFSERTVLAAFADQVVLPKYVNFSKTTAALAQSLKSFASSPNQASLDNARQSWKQARVVWEKTEAFAFGPAGSQGYDGAMDSWPVNEADVNKIVASSTAIKPENIAQLEDGQKGMHTIEYLLFGKQNDKKLTQFKDRDRQYLSALGQDLNRVSKELLKSWQAGVEGQLAYREVIAKAGEEKNSVYPTTTAGAQELVSGIIDCVAEVADEKIGKPLAEKSSKSLESRFSDNTHADLVANITGARNAYLGVIDGQSAAASSLSAYIVKKDAKLDKQILSEFQQALASLTGLTVPIEKSITDPAGVTKLQAAKETLATLQKTLEEKLAPLI